jgi:small-conductance mechanosensitive channel
MGGMKRLILPLLLLACLAPAAVLGQTVPPPSRPPPQPAPVTSSVPVPGMDARRALDILKDPRQRAELMAVLEAMAAAQGALAVKPQAGQPVASPDIVPDTPPAAAPQAAKPLAIPLEPDSLGANLLVGITELTNRAANRLVESAMVTRGLPRLASWLWTLLTDPGWREVLLDAAWRLVLAFAIGLSAMHGARRLLRSARAGLLLRAPRPPEPPQPALDRAEEGDTEPPRRAHPAAFLWQRLPFVSGHLLLELLPVVAFLAGVQLVMATPLGGSRLTQLVLLAPLHGYALWQATLCISAALTAPKAPYLRLLPVSDAAADYLQRQIRWLSGLAFFGDAGARAGWLLGMSATAHAAAERTFLLIAHIGLAVIVVRQRKPVAAWLAELAEARHARYGKRVPLWVRLAPVWHWIALFALFASWLLLLLEQVGSPAQVLGFLLGSIAVLVLARLASMATQRALDGLDAPDGDEAAPSGSLHGWLRAGSRLGIMLLTILALFQVWGFSVLPWLFDTALGRQILGGFGTIGITLAIAIAVWELSNLSINRHLNQLRAEARVGKAARLRTLLPMLRTSLLVSILIIVGLTVLSELGVNIAPLLAGAGVLGIAIGFGSQTLVRDVITGLFLLLENVMQVGDVVTLGGLTGVVEELSIRSIRLRAEDGAVHVIPFSAVTTVTNMTRDFGHAVVETRVAITEDYDRVVALLRATFEEMRKEEMWEAEITGDLDMQGLARLDDTAMVIKCRLRCGPFARWRILREFQRRMQQNFAAAGVQLPVTGVQPLPAR